MLTLAVGDLTDDIIKIRCIHLEETKQFEKDINYQPNKMLSFNFIMSQYWDIFMN